MIESILILIVTFLFVTTSAYIDAEHLKDGDWIESHASRAVQRFIFVLTVSISSIKGGLAAAIFIAVFFDQVLNGMRGLPLLHLGSTAKWDIFWKNRIVAYVVVKVLLLITGLIILFI